MNLEIVDPRWARNIAFDLDELELTDSQDVIAFLLHAVSEGLANGDLAVKRRTPLSVFMKL